MLRFIKQIFTGHQLVPGSVLGVRDISMNKMDKTPCLPGVDILILFAGMQKDIRKFVNFFKGILLNSRTLCLKKQVCRSICHMN